MSAIDSLRRGEQPRPSFITCHAKQYWPAWVYKTAVGGAAVAQYGLGRRDVAVCFGGGGLIAMYVLSYFFGKADPIVIPQVVKEYQDQNAKNMDALQSTEQAATDIDRMTAEGMERMEEGRVFALRNSQTALQEKQDLAELHRKVSAEKDELQGAFTQLGGFTKQIRNLQQEEEKHIGALMTSKRKLEEVVRRSETFLTNRGLEDVETASAK